MIKIKTTDDILNEVEKKYEDGSYPLSKADKYCKKRWVSVESMLERIDSLETESSGCNNRCVGDCDTCKSFDKIRKELKWKKLKNV